MAWDNSLTNDLAEEVVASIAGGPLRVLELGCGTGLITQHLTRAGHDIVALDLCPAMIERAIRACPEANFVVGDALRPPLRSGGFDAVVVANLIQFLPDEQAAIEAWCRLLKPSGQLVITYPHPDLTSRKAIKQMARSRSPQWAWKISQFMFAHTVLLALRLLLDSPAPRRPHLGQAGRSATESQMLVSLNAFGQPTSVVAG